MELEHFKPWEKLSELISAGNAGQIKEYVDNLNADEIVSSVSHITTDERTQLLKMLQPEDAADVIEDMPYVQAFQMMGELDARDAAAIINEMQSDDQADILADMEDDEAEAIITEMRPEEAKNVRKLIRYDDDTAGGMMITEFVAFEEHKTVGEVVQYLRDKSSEFEGFNVQYIYVSKRGKFSGVLQIRSLILSKQGTPLSDIVIRNARTVRDNTSLDELIDFFNEYDFYGVPVINERNKMVGVVLRKDILEAETELANMELLSTQGIVGGEELRTLPVLLRSRRRLSWLSVNILLNIIAASVIAFYQDTLQAVIALAVFLPIISDMSGCSGNQAVAVSLRELSLGVVKPFEVIRVWFQEVSVGLINGLVLGILIGIAAWLWKGNIYLSLVVGGALTINTVVAVSLGGTLPLILRRFGVDPALASGPILTTITDMLGFFLALTFASLTLSYLR